DGAAFADDDLREMGERGEIARGSDGALRWDDGMDAGVEHFAERVDDFRANAAEAFGEGVGSKKHHRAGFGFAEGRADTAGVRADQIDLQLADLLGGNTNGSEFAEAGID